MTQKEYEEKEKEIFNTLLKTVKAQKEHSHEGSDYLVSAFQEVGSRYFCQFIGMTEVALLWKKTISKKLAVGVFSSITMAGMTLTRQEGYGEAKVFYGSTGYKKELGATA